MAHDWATGAAPVIVAGPLLQPVTASVANKPIVDMRFTNNSFDLAIESYDGRSAVAMRSALLGPPRNLILRRE
jgi:hypothetical protein